MTEIIGQQACL